MVAVYSFCLFGGYMEKKNKRLLIDEELFRMMYQYFFYGREDLRDEICNSLEEKMNERVDRDLFTKSITAGTEEERKAYRIAYHNRKGTPKDFRY